MTDVTKLAKAIFDLIERHQNNHEPLLRYHVEDVVRANAMQILHPMVTVTAETVKPTWSNMEYYAALLSQQNVAVDCSSIEDDRTVAVRTHLDPKTNQLMYEQVKPEDFFDAATWR